ncbi:transmembrane protein 182-like [Corythoichthys intestinalis]|uniref:transmembrane protein 182-like n=1 Tax=Corythoichthys intestinalis TaxID=161448 RepID=UPI0025A5CE0A|nr:transmembrane protein 182-like [Corythoichthys intestinalis]
MSEGCHLSPNDRLSLLVFFALFSGAVGVVATLFSCATNYWLLGSAEFCHTGDGVTGTKATDCMLFHEGLFWRCSFPATSPKYSILDLWFSPHVKVCQAAFLFPFPVKYPFWVESQDFHDEPYEHYSAIVFRTFWSIFLITGVATVLSGGLSVICTAPLTNHKFYKVGGALLLCGGLCLLIVVFMYLMWVQILDTLEEFTRGQHVSGCMSFHLSIQHGPSFMLAPVGSFFSLLSGLLFLVLARSARSLGPNRTNKTPQPPVVETDL